MRVRHKAVSALCQGCLLSNEHHSWSSKFNPSLHPAVIIMSVYVTFFFCLVYAVSGVSNAQFIPDREIRKTIVDDHNVLRRKVATRWAHRGLGASNMRKMSWDEELENEAASQATCDSIGDSSAAESSVNWGGSSVMFFEDFEKLGRGKNVAISSHHNVEQMLHEWSAGESYFDYKLQTCRHDYDCKAFKQMIWARADRVGCSLNPFCQQDGQSVKVLVCLYNEMVNILFDLYTVGPVCSGCEGHTGFCEDSLCVSSCHGSSTETCGCHKTCNHLGVGQGTLDQDTCTCSCLYGLGADCSEPCENPQPYVDYDFCAEIDTPESCEMEREFHIENCPANCDFGCRPAP